MTIFLNLLKLRTASRLLILVCSSISIQCSVSGSSKRVLTRDNIKAALLGHQIIPDVIPKAPKRLVKLSYIDGFTAKLGNILAPQIMRFPPFFISWPFENSTLYTLMMTDAAIMPSVGTRMNSVGVVKCAMQPSYTKYDAGLGCGGMANLIISLDGVLTQRSLEVDLTRRNIADHKKRNSGFCQECGTLPCLVSFSATSLKHIKLMEVQFSAVGTVVETLNHLTSDSLFKGIGVMKEMPDPDVPSRHQSFLGEYIHWLVGNMKGPDLATGNTLAEYLSPDPEPDSGYHRYTFLVWEQSGFINFTEPVLEFDRNDTRRIHFSARKFAEKHKFRTPHAINFCLSAYNKSSIDGIDDLCESHGNNKA